MIKKEATYTFKINLRYCSLCFIQIESIVPQSKHFEVT